MPHRRIAIALFALALLLPSAAGAMGIEKGVKAGADLSNFRGSFADLVDTKWKAGFVGGAFVAFGFAPDLAVQVEALYSMKGAKMSVQMTNSEGVPTGEFVDVFANVNYLEVPVLLRGTLLKGSPVQPMYYLGPTVAFSLGGKVESDDSRVQSEDIKDLKTVDFGLALGAGGGFKVGGQRVLTELRYTTGFTDIYDVSGNLESINQQLALTAGIAF